MTCRDGSAAMPLLAVSVTFRIVADNRHLCSQITRNNITEIALECLSSNSLITQ